MREEVARFPDLERCSTVDIHLPLVRDSTPPSLVVGVLRGSGDKRGSEPQVDTLGELPTGHDPPLGLRRGEAGHTSGKGGPTRRLDMVMVPLVSKSGLPLPYSTVGDIPISPLNLVSEVRRTLPPNRRG